MSAKLTIIVDAPDAWRAVLQADDGSGEIEAISIGGPGAAAAIAIGVYSRRNQR